MQGDQWGNAALRDNGNSPHDDTTGSESGCELEDPTAGVPERRVPRRREKPKDVISQVRKERKKTFRQQNRTNQDCPAGPALSNIADITQKEIMKAIGNALLQRGQ